MEPQKVSLTDEQIQQIKKMTNAVGLFIIVTDTMLPCPDALSGDGCTGKHTVIMGGEKIHPGEVSGLIQEMLSRGTQIK